MLVMSITNRRARDPGPIDGAGELQATASTVEGTGTAANANFGALEAGSAIISGTGIVPSIGSGDLQAAAAVIEGTGIVAYGIGALEAGSSVVDGSGTNTSPLTTSYSNPLGTGNRTASITVTSTLAPSSGTLANLVDGAFGNNVTDSMFWSGGQSGRRLTFDIGTAKVINEARFKCDNATTNGTWKWQGSNTNNGSDWVDLSSTFAFAGTGLGAGTVMGDMSTNVTQYRYYSLFQTAGVTSAAMWHQEWEFKVEA